MASKPQTIDGYHRDSFTRVRSTCLYVATKLGDLLDDIVIVGGLVPSLLVDQESLPWGLDGHAGTMDLDMGLSLALLNEERYHELGSRLQAAGFEPDINRDGNPTSQRWRASFQWPITVDFLIQPSRRDDKGGRLRNIETGFAATITPGLGTAFQDRRKVTLTGETPSRERATRSIWACGPGAFTVLKLLAFDGRGENKDAYDLYYVWRGLGVEEIARCIEPLLDDPVVQSCVDIIKRDFLEHRSAGPRRAAEFMTRGPDDDIQADLVGLASSLLSQLR